MSTEMTAKNPRSKIFAILAVVVLSSIVALGLYRHGSTHAAPNTAPPSIPVTVTEAAQRDVPIYYDALGTVQALNTVAIRAQVNGQIISIDFRQGQEVRQGDVLAKIDPTPFKANFDQAVSKKSQDEAQLIDAQKDLARFKTLVQRDYETQQNVDAQQAKVDQTKSMIDADQAAIEAAQTQLRFATITAPIDGVVGFRQVDLGNIIHTNDVNPLTVLTTIKPCTVIFTLPQSDLGPVREAMLNGTVPVIAFDQDDKQQLAQGHLLLINNQIDQTTSTIQLKAGFPNEDERLWPGEFVRIRILIQTRKDAITIPPVAVQHGPNGLYTWVVKPDNTVDQRSIETIPVNNSDTTIVTKGVSAGERIVVNGQYRLDVGSRVDARMDIKTQTPAAAPKS
ncbi:MAG TPA: efflux RND transporter periplasmic adaptor subunit [Xanthobacteraceae bacterium]|jgi:multidrug efflux system membrane fusion protein|nr:efflux RND transporter periplasmic adaptor subunit [Xanthobacteraceae bacterium]